MNLSSIGPASECRDRCGGLQYAYALIHYPACRCVPSELYKLVDTVYNTDCVSRLCSDDTFCGGERSASSQCDNDCRCINQLSLFYSSFIASSSGMTHSCFLACWVDDFILYDGILMFEGWTTNFHLSSNFKLKIGRTTKKYTSIKLEKIYQYLYVIEGNLNKRMWFHVVPRKFSLLSDTPKIMIHL